MKVKLAGHQPKNTDRRDTKQHTVLATGVKVELAGHQPKNTGVTPNNTQS